MQNIINILEADKILDIKKPSIVAGFSLNL